ncbi:MAG: ketoacyl-ACP synthase III [Synergistaceae bacterium]|nr:ketoacyl-ACP synthase III [Synergistaceae bacterium]
MPVFDCVRGVDVAEIVCALPAQTFSLAEYAPNLLNEKTAARLAKSTGFSSLRIAPEGVTTADLFAEAAGKILEGRRREEVAGLVFVSKTPDYDMPATSHVLQHKLGLSNSVICIDISEGCSGFVRGLYVAAMMSSRLGAPVLLGCGDTNSRITDPDDRASRCIYGDGASAILVTPGGQDIPFAFATYGEKYGVVIMENSRSRITPSPKRDGYIYLDGVEILNFSMNEVPEAITSFMERNSLTRDSITLYACHQANKLILDSLADKLGVPREKMPFTSGDIGNESSASIPSVIVRTDAAKHQRVLCCGFGVGLSVGVCLADFSGTKTREVYLS